MQGYPIQDAACKSSGCCNLERPRGCLGREPLFQHRGRRHPWPKEEPATARLKVECALHRDLTALREDNSYSSTYRMYTKLSSQHFPASANVKSIGHQQIEADV